MQFSGLYTAILSPFCDEGQRVDFDAYVRLLERQIAAGVRGIVPCGTTGESPTLSHSEHRELIRHTVQCVQNRAQVLAGTGSNSTQEAIELTQTACEDGVDAVMLVNPYYNKPSQKGLIQHFLKIADCSSVPIVLYNIQGRTGVNIEVETMRILSQHERIQAVKEASGDPLQMIALKKACGDKLSLLCGDDNITPAFMGLGGQGVVSVVSNLYPRRMAKLMEYYMQSDFKSANSLFYEFVDLMNALFWRSNPIPVKAAAAIMGLCKEDLRLPLTPMEKDLRQKLAEILANMGEDQ